MHRKSSVLVVIWFARVLSMGAFVVMIILSNSQDPHYHTDTPQTLYDAAAFILSSFMMTPIVLSEFARWKWYQVPRFSKVNLVVMALGFTCPLAEIISIASGMPLR